MDRRKFLKTAGVGTAAATATGLATPLIAQESPELKWRLTSSFPNSLDTIFGAAQVFADRVKSATDGKFQIDVFPAGELAPGLQAVDAVMDGSVEMAHTASYYYIGKDPSWAFGTAVPHGMNARMMNAWWYMGGGKEAMNEFYNSQGVEGFAGGNTGVQMGGWFRKEINGLADLEGLKFRIGGLGGRVVEKLGVVPQQVAGGDIYPSLEKGTIDGAEWVGPYDDSKLGFQKVAPFYYYPGFWEGGPMLNFFINKEQHDGLPDHYKSIIEAATQEANTIMMATYDAKNPAALKELISGGAQLKKFPDEVLKASADAAAEVYAEIGAENETFKKLHDNYMEFKNNTYLWFSIAELQYDIFQAQNRGE